MEQKKISIVIPVYGTEKYVDRCFHSLLNQSYENLEIVVVNDCSPGDIEEIVYRYMKSDERFKYVKHDVNRGLFQTRVTGMSYVTGDYVAFLDSDDYVTYDYYRLLLSKAIEKDADIVIAHKNFAKGGAKILNTAKEYRVQIFYVKTNSMAQIQKVLKDALDFIKTNLPS